MSEFNVATLLDTFLAALDDSEGGARVLALHRPEAMVRHPDGLGRADRVDPAEFAQTHRELCVQGRAVLPRFTRERLLKSDPDVVWFEVRQAHAPQSMHILALGMLENRIGWCTLSPRVESWTYREGLLHCVAEYSGMRRVEPARPRALLEASYLRMHWRAPIQFATLPDARFSCQMSTDCCRHDFEITLPREAQAVIDAMPWEELRPDLVGTQLPVRSDGKLQLKSLNETCRFLGSHSQCLIHQRLGRQPFGPCSIFPFSFAWTPEGVAVSMSPICGASRRGMGVGLREREEDLRERLLHAQPRRPETFRLAPDQEIRWEQFRDIEKVLCEILAAQDFPMRQRLHLGSRLLAAVRDNEPLDIERWRKEPPTPITPQLREALRGMLLKVLAWDRAALRALPQAVPAGLAQVEILEHPVLARVLQNTLFCKIYSYPYDLTTAYNFLVVLYLLALVMQEAAHGPLTDIMWRELGSLGVHGLLKSILHEGIPEGFRTLVGTAEFGQWLLLV